MSKIVKGVSINGKAGISNRPFAVVSSLVEVSTEWNKEQAALERRKAARREVEMRGAFAQAALSNVATIRKVNQAKFETLSAAIFKDEK
jgi:hypothetical protein